MVSVPILIERLKASPVKIISAVIYGSWAKGTQTADSDIDILLVSDEIAPRKNKRGKDVARIKGCLSIGIPLDIFLLTPDETASNFKNHNPLFLDIAVEGTILIDSDDFLQNLIEETKAYIYQRKLEKLADGWRFPVLYREPTFLSSVSNTHFVGEILIERVNNIEIDTEWKERLYNAAKISSEIEPEVTWSRYPGIDKGELWIPYEEYTMDDAVEVKDKTEMAVKTAKDFIKWWFEK